MTAGFAHFFAEVRSEICRETILSRSKSHHLRQPCEVGVFPIGKHRRVAPRQGLEIAGITLHPKCLPHTRDRKLRITCQFQLLQRGYDFFTAHTHFHAQRRRLKRRP